MKKTKLTGIVIAKNESKNISRCLRSLRFCSEIILVDDYSTDNTVEIAKSYNAKIYKRKLNSNFSDQRNFAMSRATNKWLLFVDADEIVSKELAKKISEVIQSDVNNGYLICRTDILWGQKMRHGEVGQFKILRLGKKNEGTWIRKVHEVWKIKGNVGSLSEEIYHYPHQTISDFVFDVGTRALIHSGELKKEKKKVNLAKVLIWPPGKFFYYYFVKTGFMDGIRGFILAVIMSFHSFLAWSELWMSKC